MEQSYQAASDAGVTFQMELLEPQDDTDVYYARMASKISSICRHGVDGIFVTIPNEAVIPSIQECLDLNVPVISINSGASSAIDLGLIHHISQLGYTAGYRGGKRFLMEQQQNNNYNVTFGVCVVHEPGNSGLVDRCQGFKDAIVESVGTADAYIDPPVVDEGFYDTDALYKAAIEDLVSQRPGAIVDGNDDDWEGVVIMSPSSGRAPAILELKQVHSKVLVGTFDTNDYIFDSLDSGDMLFAIDQGSFLQGYLPVWLLTHIASTKQNLRNTFIETGPTFNLKAPSEALTVCESNRFEVCKPVVEEDLNQLTRVRPVGYTLCGVVFSVSIGFALWSLIRRNQFYVIQSQPTFLVAVCFGTFILGSAIIPLGIDDSMASIEASSKACMAVPWLVALGFTITFAALFSKLWRINRLMKSARRYKRTNIGSIQAFVPVICVDHI